MKILIKNMVCNRCISAVENIFENLNIKVWSVILGEVETEKELTVNEIATVNQSLQDQGFQILEDRVKIQIEKIKNTIILEINSLDLPEDFILSKFISARLGKDYSLLSKNFSLLENVTLEQYFILQKIEKVKELLLYNEFSLTEISQKLGYKSVQHLSAQFKNSTGFTPTTFKKLKLNDRTSLDLI